MNKHSPDTQGKGQPICTIGWLRWLAPAMLALLGLTAFGGAPMVAANDAPASLIVNVYTCDSHNDPIDPNQTLANECNLGTEDLAFTLESSNSQAGSAMASTGSGGAPATISFTDIPAGDYRLVQQTSGAVALSYVAQCTSTVRTFSYPFSPFAIIEPGGRLNVQLLPGEQLTCDWYNVEAESAATMPHPTLAITVYSCNGDVLDPAICELAPDIEFTITNPTTMIEQHLITGPDGTVIFDGTGDVQLTATTTLPDRDFCAFEPTGVFAGGILALDPATPIALDAYYCYPGA